MAEEVTTVFASLETVVSLLGVGVVGNNEGVLVSGLDLEGADRGRSVVHTLADLGHRVLLQVVGVALLLVNGVKSFAGGFVEGARLVVLLSEEALTGQRVELRTLLSSACLCSQKVTSQFKLLTLHTERLVRDEPENLRL